MNKQEFKELSIDEKLNELYRFVGTILFTAEKSFGRAQAYLTQYTKHLSRESAQSYLKLHIDDMCNVDNI